MKAKRFAQKKEAQNAIWSLFEKAKGDVKNSKKFVALARRLSLKTKTRIPRNVQRSYCAKCSVWFVPGKNCTLRVRKSLIVTTCIECGNIQRFGI